MSLFHKQNFEFFFNVIFFNFIIFIFALYRLSTLLCCRIERSKDLFPSSLILSHRMQILSNAMSKFRQKIWQKINFNPALSRFENSWHCLKCTYRILLINTVGKFCNLKSAHISETTGSACMSYCSSYIMQFVEGFPTIQGSVSCICLLRARISLTCDEIQSKYTCIFDTADYWWELTNSYEY